MKNEGVHRSVGAGGGGDSLLCHPVSELRRGESRQNTDVVPYIEDNTVEKST